MSFEGLQSLKYGWWALAGVVLTGTSIYVANNTRKYVEPIDIITITLGTVERCYTTQLSTGHWDVATNFYPAVTSQVTSLDYSLGIYPNRIYTNNGSAQFDQFMYDENLGYNGGTLGEVTYNYIGAPYSESWRGYFVYYNSSTTNGFTNTWWWAKQTTVTNTVTSTQYSVVSTNWTGESFSVTPPTLNTIWTTNSYPSDLYIGVYYVISQTNKYGIMTNGIYTNTWVNKVIVTTNISTNTFGFHVDAPVLDAKIKALIPYFVDPDSVVEGSSNIVSLTATSLWVTLEIGNYGPTVTNIHWVLVGGVYVLRTNMLNGSSFTREPCWTNQIQTNYTVCYTVDTSTLVYDHTYNVERSNYNGISYQDYWIIYGTNHSASTSTYNSTIPETVNFIGSHNTLMYQLIYMAATNIQYDYRYWYFEPIYTDVVYNTPFTFQTTNQATYADTVGYFMYPEDLQERYKVLQALQVAYKDDVYGSYTGRYAWAGTPGEGYTSWVDAVEGLAVNWTSSVYSAGQGYGELESAFPADGAGNRYQGWEFYGFIASAHYLHCTNIYSPHYFHTAVVHNVQFWYNQATSVYANTDWGAGSTKHCPVDIYESGGFPSDPSDSGWHKLIETGDTTDSQVRLQVSYGQADLSTVPDACDNVVTGSSHYCPYYYDGYWYSNVWAEARGGPAVTDSKAIVLWQFNYCTDKYW